MLGWDYFTEQHTFSCVDGAPKCPLQGASRADVGDAVETALEQLNRRYQPRLRFQKQRLLNGYRRFDPARGMARYWMLGAGALGRPRGMVRGGRREEGSGWGTHIYLWRIHVDIWQNQYNIVKLKNKVK